MTFLESIKTCLIDKYATFSGRASRSEFWWFFLFLIIVGFVLDMLFPWAQWIINLFLFITFLSVEVRRLHDINRSGWWQLIYFFPVVGWIVFLYWMIKKGTPGPNRFGEDPLQQPQFMNPET
jgi:uncharacterized membrane protein YhaH (DUF805 family)